MHCRFLLLAALLLFVLTSRVMADESIAAAVKAPRPFLSIDYTVHPTFGSAVKNSFAPTDYKANVGAVLKNTVEPLNPLRYVGSVVVVEVQKQLASGEGFNIKKVVEKLDPAGLAGGYFGAQLGETVGAVAQTALARGLGPIGGTVGFALRPILWLAGSSIGMEVGKGIAQGKPGNPLNSGMAVALREFNPILDSTQMIGDNIGGVIGQALIPVPFVGLMVGATLGGVSGLLLGRAITATGPGKKLDEYLRDKLKGKAATLDGNAAPRSGEAAIDVPIITGATTTRAAPAPAAPIRTGAQPDHERVQKAYQALQGAMRGGDPAKLMKAHAEYKAAKEGK